MVTYENRVRTRSKSIAESRNKIAEEDQRMDRNLKHQLKQIKNEKHKKNIQDRIFFTDIADGHKQYTGTNYLQSFFW